MSPKYITFDASKQELWFDYADKRIEIARKQDNWPLCQEVAKEWAQPICKQLGLPSTGIWKLFKRSLVAHWFGLPEKKGFPAGWTVEDVLEYADRFEGHSIRFSLFPEDIACHAESFRLPIEQKQAWAQVLSKVDNSTAMEMFPETSEEAICFRRYTTLFHEVVIYEAGLGQAMFVFEQERGQHPVVAATNTEEGFNIRTIPSKNNVISSKIESRLKLLIYHHDYYLSAQCFGLCRTLGIDSVSIEGYFDLNVPDDLLIVDLDLPFDFVFMTT
jgi:hypothetical protein